MATACAPTLTEPGADPDLAVRGDTEAGDAAQVDARNAERRVQRAVRVEALHVARTLADQNLSVGLEGQGGDVLRAGSQRVRAEDGIVNPGGTGDAAEGTVEGAEEAAHVGVAVVDRDDPLGAEAQVEDDAG